MLVEDYLSELPRLHSWDHGETWNTGGFERGHLRELYAFLTVNLPEDPVLLETGAGNSTITMLLLQPERLISIAPDAELFERIRAFCRQNGIPDAALEAHVDFSQWVLPRLAMDRRAGGPCLDFALIDGNHGWPTAFVDLEYTHSMLRQGAYLMIDDVQLHAEKEMARLLSESPDFSIVLDIGKSLVFRKLTDKRDLGDWWGQPYIRRRTEACERDWPNPFALHEPGALAKTTHWMKRLPGRVRRRLA